MCRYTHCGAAKYFQSYLQCVLECWDVLQLELIGCWHIEVWQEAGNMTNDAVPGLMSTTVIDSQYLRSTEFRHAVTFGKILTETYFCDTVESDDGSVRCRVYVFISFDLLEH